MFAVGHYAYGGYSASSLSIYLLFHQILRSGIIVVNRITEMLELEGTSEVI